MRARRSSAGTGVLVAAGGVALTTVLLVPLRDVAPVESLGVAYLVPVLLVASVWGGVLGAATAVAGAVAFNWFHLPPTGRLALAEPGNWVGLVVLLLAALVASSLAERAEARAHDAEQRRAEADVTAEAARLLLRGGRLRDALPAVSALLGDALEARGVELVLAPTVVPDDRRALPLREDDRDLGALLVPSGLAAATVERLERHVVPALQGLLAAAVERDALLDDVVETQALRRSDVLKTALLRAVSHDLRSPLTAILAAQDALRTPALPQDERDDLVHGIGTEATRLSQLIDKLLDLGRLEGGAVEPQRGWCSLAEVVEAAVDAVGAGDGAVKVSIDPELPEVRADAAQLERALANLLENAIRFSGGHPVLVRGRAVGGRVVLRIVDRGPGVPAAELERIFLPFHRTGTPDGHRGSGLGLAIVRGFVEANGGRVWAESVPHQGTTFVVELPLDPAPVRIATTGTGPPGEAGPRAEAGP